MPAERVIGWFGSKVHEWRYRDRRFLLPFFGDTFFVLKTNAVLFYI